MVSKRANDVRERAERVMSLWRLDQYSQREIAETVGVTEAAVSKIIKRVLDKHTAEHVEEGLPLYIERIEAGIRKLLPLATAEPQLIVDEDDETTTYIIPAKYQLEAFDRLIRGSERVSKWKGWDAPTKTESTVALNTSDPKADALALVDKLSAKKKGKND